MSAELTPLERRRAAWEIACPRCEAHPGHPCVRPRGGRGHHRERQRAVTTCYAPEEIRALLERPVRRHDGYQPEPSGEGSTGNRCQFPRRGRRS